MPNYRLLFLVSIFSVFLLSACGGSKAKSITNSPSVVDNDYIVQQAHFKAFNIGNYDGFGKKIALSGDTLVVSAIYEDNNINNILHPALVSISDDNALENAGAVYVYKRTGTTWILEAYIKPSNITQNDNFGSSIAISADTIVVGSYSEDSNQTTITNGTTASTDKSLEDSGAVYIYKRTGSTWAQEAYIKAPNADSNDQFGYSVDIQGDTVVVGARYENSNQNTITNGTTASANNSNIDSGAVYIFKRTGSTWAQEAYIKASNCDPYDEFGVSVAISGDTVAVGANNEDSNETTINSTGSTNNEAKDSGAVYIYKRTGATWAEQAYIKAKNNFSNFQFGENIDLDGDSLVVGTPKDYSEQTTITQAPPTSNSEISANSGAVFVFKRSGSTWGLEAFIKSKNSFEEYQFGKSVSISGNLIVAGATNESSSYKEIIMGTMPVVDDGEENSGAAYVFARDGSTWGQEAYIKASNSYRNQNFGNSTAIDGNSIAVGAEFESSSLGLITNGEDSSTAHTAPSGATYLYLRTPP